jgi:hypothetical protein
MIAELQALAGGQYAQPPEVLWLSGRQLRKREGGAHVAMLLRLLRYAWAVALQGRCAR